MGQECLKKVKKCQLLSSFEGIFRKRCRRYPSCAGTTCGETGSI